MVLPQKRTGVGPMADLRDLLMRPGLASELSPAEAVEALGELLPIHSALVTRARAPVPPSSEPVSPEDSWISVDEAAALARVTRRVVYGWSRRKDWSRFTARPSRKVLRIKRAAFLSWLEATGREGRRP